MPSTLPDGDPAPLDGSLPEEALSALGSRPFAFYLHVPFCRVRCGYCDFNTYTAEELGTTPGASRTSFMAAAADEIRLARRILGDRDLPVRTVFLGGGTPTLLPAADLVQVLAVMRQEFGFADDLEVTTEANPDSVDLAYLQQLREGGYTRVSFGMQSAVPHVLATLERTHDPERVPQVVAWAREAGFEHLSLDLIYGTPGESTADWETSLAAALVCAPDHVSAYSLIVEPGTAMARKVRRGEVQVAGDDELADKYLMADAAFSGAGLSWYEVSNWAQGPASRCHHNELYWTGADWWGVGPGAHSHVQGVRWWNVKHPAAYADRIAAGHSPAHARELLDAETRRVERILLELRLVDGLDLTVLDAHGRKAVAGVVADGLATLVPAPGGGRLVLTQRGRLLADAVVRDLIL